MKNIAWIGFVIMIACMVISCKQRKVSDMELYGNTFIHINMDDFDVPYNWTEYELMDGACSIMMPPYMKKTVWDGTDVIDDKKGTNFCYNDTTDWNDSVSVKSRKYYYTRVYVDYIRASHGTFSKPGDIVSSAETDQQLEQMAYNEIQDRTLILNGPFVDWFFTNNPLTNGQKPTQVLDTYYRRKGLTGEGPVSVHIFLIQNDDKAVKIMMAYHDKDSLEFKDLFNSAKTFRWKQQKNSRQ